MRIYSKVCGNLIETKKRYGDREEEANPKLLQNYSKYIFVDDLCKELGWCESHNYVNKLAGAGFKMNYEYDPSVSPLGRIIAEHSIKNNECLDIIRLILFVKKVVVPLQDDRTT